jgi:hypothetical protein
MRTAERGGFMNRPVYQQTGRFSKMCESSWKVAFYEPAGLSENRSVCFEVLDAGWSSGTVWYKPRGLCLAWLANRPVYRETGRFIDLYSFLPFCFLIFIPGLPWELRGFMTMVEASRSCEGDGESNITPRRRWCPKRRTLRFKILQSFNNHELCT